MTQTTHAKARYALAAAFVAAAAYLSHGLLPAILWACVVAVGLDPLRGRMLRMAPGRDTAIALALTVLAAAVIIVPLAIAATQAAGEIRDLAQWIQTARVEGIPVPAWVGSIPFGREHVVGWWASHLAEPGAAARQLSGVNVSSILGGSKAIGIDVLGRIVAFGFIVTTLFFLLRDRDAVVEQLSRGVEKAFGETGTRLGGRIMASVRGTIDGVVLVGLGQGAVMGVVYFACGVPHPVLLSILTAVGAMLPFGLVLVMIVPIGLLLASGSLVALAIVAAVGFVSNFVADHVVRPALIGGATSLPFMWVLVGLIGGLETIGLLGLFVGPAVMAVLVMMWREFVAEDQAHD